MYRVMIVDDDIPFTRGMEAFNWAQEDCKVVCTARNGMEALEKCTVVCPHIVITDINMPVMDGIELTEQLGLRYPEIQVILLTVHQEFAFAQQAIAYGASNYLVKDMNYREQLPRVLEKAKDAFKKQNPRLLSLLKNSGQVLFAESTEKSDWEAFLLTFGGTLYTVRYDPQEEQQLFLEEIDRRLENDTGWILWQDGTAEMLSKGPLRANTLPERHSLAVYTTCVTNYESYMQAHKRNRDYLESSFYTPLPPIEQAKDVSFNALSQAEAEGWARQAGIALGNGTLKNWLTTLEEKIRASAYIPEQVRLAYIDMYRQAELRWAEKLNEDIHCALLKAPDLHTLNCIFADGMAALQNATGTLSLQCDKAIQIMKEQLSQVDLSLGDIAKCVYISPGYLSKKLKEETGYSFRELLIRLRMEKAAELIAQGTKKIYEIATATGYQSYRTFAAQFESYYGVSAKKYKGLKR